MDDRRYTNTDTPHEHLKKVIEIVTENQTIFEQLACSNLPIAEDAERALALLDGHEEAG